MPCKQTLALGCLSTLPTHWPRHNSQKPLKSNIVLDPISWLAWKSVNLKLKSLTHCTYSRPGKYRGNLTSHVWTVSSRSSTMWNQTIPRHTHFFKACFWVHLQVSRLRDKTPTLRTQFLLSAEEASIQSLGQGWPWHSKVIYWGSFPSRKGFGSGKWSWTNRRFSLWWRVQM